MSFFLAIRKRKYTRSVPGCAGKPPRAVRPWSARRPATPTAASYCSAKFSQAAGTVPACIFIPTRTTPGPKRLLGGTDGPSAGLRDGSGGSCSGRVGTPSAATSHAVSGLRGGTPCRFELYALGTTVKGAGCFATAISRTRFPPGNRRRTGRRLLLRQTAEPRPGVRKEDGKRMAVCDKWGGVGYFFHAVMAGTSLDNVLYELLHYG